MPKVAIAIIKTESKDHNFDSSISRKSIAIPRSSKIKLTANPNTAHQRNFLILQKNVNYAYDSMVTLISLAYPKKQTDL